MHTKTSIKVFYKINKWTEESLVSYCEKDKLELIVGTDANAYHICWRIYIKYIITGQDSHAFGYDDYESS